MAVGQSFNRAEGLAAAGFQWCVRHKDFRFTYLTLHRRKVFLDPVNRRMNKVVE